MIEVGIGRINGPQLPARRKGLSSKKVITLFFFVVRDKGLTVFYECNKGSLPERKSVIMGYYSVGLEAFFKVHSRNDEINW